MAFGELLAETYNEQSRDDVRLKSGLWLGIQFHEPNRWGVSATQFHTPSWYTHDGCAFYLCEGRPPEAWPSLTPEAGATLAKHLSRFVQEDLGDRIALQLFGQPPVLVDDPFRPSLIFPSLRLCERPVIIPRDVLCSVVCCGAIEWIGSVLSAHGDLYVIEREE